VGRLQVHHRLDLPGGDQGDKGMDGNCQSNWIPLDSLHCVAFKCINKTNCSFVLFYNSRLPGRKAQQWSRLLMSTSFYLTDCSRVHSWTFQTRPNERFRWSRRETQAAFPSRYTTARTGTVTGVCQAVAYTKVAGYICMRHAVSPICTHAERRNHSHTY
jgi:hypothetical protein